MVVVFGDQSPSTPTGYRAIHKQHPVCRHASVLCVYSNWECEIKSEVLLWSSPLHSRALYLNFTKEVLPPLASTYFFAQSYYYALSYTDSTHVVVLDMQAAAR